MSFFLLLLFYYLRINVYFALQYKKFMDMAIQEFQPPGDNVFCHRCKLIVDTGNSSDVEVTEPEGAAPMVSGLR